MTFHRSHRSLPVSPRRRAGDTGATAVEYALLVAGVALVMIVGVAFVGGSIGGGIATAAEALTGTATSALAEGAQPAAEEPAAEQPAAEQPAAEEPAAEEPAATLSCVGHAIDRGRDSVAPTCDTTTGTWTCPRGYDLDRVSGRGVAAVYTCEED